MPRSIAKSRLEALLSIATGAAAEPLAGLAGLYGAARGGSGEGVRMIDKVRGKLTYQPRDPRGQQEIASALGPLMQKIEAGKSWLGDTAYNASGSPALGAAAYTAPDALLGALGMRPALAAGRSASKGIGGLVARAESLPAPSYGSPASQLGIFAGRNAKTADHGAMQRAAARLAAGDDPRVVWREDGWMRGPDGHMRFEIDDSQSRMAGTSEWESLQAANARGEDPIKHLKEIEAFKQQYGQNSFVKPYNRQGHGRRDLQEIGNVYEHGPLADAYPDAFSYGKYQRRDDMGIGTGAYSEDMDAVFLGPANEEVARNVMGHEMQHLVQGREGFARGGSTKNVEQYAASQGVNTDVYTPFDLYERLAGEAEARAVQKRLDYTPQQRRDVYPLDDYDVPLDELIFRGAQ